jgi:hypothetical protein
VGSAVCRALLERETGPVYLTCRATLETYYARFGFCLTELDDLPPYFRRLHRLERAASPVLRLVIGVTLIIMRRERT